MSARLRSIGSSSTPRPTRRTRTSVPGRRNSLGSRTAWLRPCLKSLAVAVSILGHALLSDIYQRYIPSISCTVNGETRRLYLIRRRFNMSVPGRLLPCNSLTAKVVVRQADLPRAFRRPKCQQRCELPTHSGDQPCSRKPELLSSYRSASLRARWQRRRRTTLLMTCSTCAPSPIRVYSPRNTTPFWRRRTMTRSFGKRSSSTYWAPRSKRELAVTQSQSPARFKVVPLQPLMAPV